MAAKSWLPNPDRQDPNCAQFADEFPSFFSIALSAIAKLGR
jgi:hypothetical protein